LTLFADAPSNKKSRWRDLEGPEEDVVFKMPTMMCIAPLRDQSWTAANTGGWQPESPSCVSERDAPNRATMPRSAAIAPIQTWTSAFAWGPLPAVASTREGPTHLSDASNKGNDAHRRRRRWHRQGGQDFRPRSRTPPSPPNGLEQPSELITPPLPQHFTVEAAMSWNSATRTTRAHLPVAIWPGTAASTPAEARTARSSPLRQHPCDSPSPKGPDPARGAQIGPAPASHLHADATGKETTHAHSAEDGRPLHARTILAASMPPPPLL
jgi:hypothetical protein